MKITHHAARLTLAAWLTLAGAALAQTALTGGLRGAVTDRSGAAIPGARVTAQSPSLLVKQTAVTDAAGGFTFLGLPPAADYEITVAAAGFRDWSRGGIAVVSETTIALDAPLEVGPVNESVTVRAADAALAANPEVSQVVDARRLAELPSNARSLPRFALLDPHVRNTSGRGGDGFAATRLSINGNIFRETHYKLDGNSNFDAVFNNAPLQALSLSAVQEFKVLTNQFAAEYGGTSAGFLVATTKSGSNEFHGEAFFFGRPSGIQARPPLSTVRAPNQLLQYGGAAGGPLVREKTYFFVNYERTQQDRGAFVQSPAPQLFVGELRDQLALVKVDHRFTELHTLALRLNGNRNTNTNAGDRVSGLTQPSAGQYQALQSSAVQLNDSLTLGRFINELRLSYVNAVPSNSLPFEPSVGVVRPGYSTEGNSAYSRVRTEIAQFVEQGTAQLGRHVVRGGVDFARQKIRDFQYDLFGTYRFAAGPPQPGEQPAQYTQRFGVAEVSSGQTRVAFFAQDDWRLLPRLTLNLGLRYDYQSIVEDRNNFGPRLGFALDVTGDGRTVLRGGAGVYYDQPFYHGFVQRFLLSGVEAPISTYTLAPGAPGFPAFPDSLTAPPAEAAIARRNLNLRGDGLRSPYTTQVSLGLQRRLFGDWVATVDGVHSFSVKQFQQYDFNAPAPFPRTAPGQARSVAEADSTRPLATFMGVPVRQLLVTSNAGKASYNALDLGLSRRFIGRYQFEAHYVYSSSINSLTDDHLGTNPNEWGDAVRGERGPNDFHQRHRFVAHGTALLPWQSQLSAVVTLASGTPINALTGVDNNGDTTNADRAVGFGRNPFRGPRQTSFDVSLAKQVPLKQDRVQIELRADVFNLFNNSNYYQFNNVYGNGATPLATFRQPLAGVSNVDPGRQIQFGARLVF